MKKIIANFKTKLAEKKRKKQMKKYFMLLKTGSMFIQYIYQDLEKMKSNKMNRATRRRFETQFKKNGKLNEEIALYYAQKVDQVLAQCDPKGTL